MLGTLSADLMLQACLCTTDVSHNVIMCCSPYMHQRNADQAIIQAVAASNGLGTCIINTQ